MQDIKQNFCISGIVVGMDAQVEVKPHHEPFVGGGTRMYRGKIAEYIEMEAKFGSILMPRGQSYKHFLKNDGSLQEQR